MAGPNLDISATTAGKLPVRPKTISVVPTSAKRCVRQADQPRSAACLDGKFLGLLITMFVVIGLLGCRDQEEGIRVYRVPKPQPQRLIAAMIPHGNKIWIFKLVGSDAKVAAVEGEFIALLQSIKFDESPDANPQWELADGWERLPDDHPSNSGAFPRFATIYKPDEEHVERTDIAVSSLPKRADVPWEIDVKRNVMRWRGQLDLPDVSFAQLDSYTDQLELDHGLTATLVKLFGGETPEMRESTGAPDGAVASDDQLPFTYEKPDTWAASPKATFSLLGFRVTEGDETADISVTPAGGGLLLNVNRWRGQIGLKPIEQEELDETAQQLDAGDVTFAYVQLVGSERTILAAVGSHEGQMWFITLKGGNALVQREIENFEKFVTSIRFKS